jgi:tRNA threonylcarbamoyladenosine biosynthesis protein TsaB
MKKTLLFDVSTPVMFVGYAKGDQLVDFSIRLAKRDHAKYLVDRIDQLLTRYKLTLDDMDQIVIGRGPGSYTGIRIAVTVAKTLAYAKHIPLYDVSSLLFMSSGFSGLIGAMIDARRGHVFGLIYDDHQVVLEDGYYELNTLSKHPMYQQAQIVFLDEFNYKVDIKKIFHFMLKVDNLFGYEPNYARITEAEQHAN